jgi:hypothetical protein
MFLVNILRELKSLARDAGAQGAHDEAEEYIEQLRQEVEGERKDDREFSCCRIRKKLLDELYRERNRGTVDAHEINEVKAFADDVDKLNPPRQPGDYASLIEQIVGRKNAYSSLSQYAHPRIGVLDCPVELGSNRIPDWRPLNADAIANDLARAMEHVAVLLRQWASDGT